MSLRVQGTTSSAAQSYGPVPPGAGTPLKLERRWQLVRSMCHPAHHATLGNDIRMLPAGIPLMPPRVEVDMLCPDTPVPPHIAQAVLESILAARVKLGFETTFWEMLVIRHRGEHFLCVQGHTDRGGAKTLLELQTGVFVAGFGFKTPPPHAAGLQLEPFTHATTLRKLVQRWGLPSPPWQSSVVTYADAVGRTSTAAAHP